MADKKNIRWIIGAPEWLVTFGDMMTLLLTFFILLFSMAEIREPGKLYDVASVLDGTVISRPVYGYTIPKIEDGHRALLENAGATRGDTGRSGARRDPNPNPSGDGRHAITVWESQHPHFVGHAKFTKGQTYLTDTARKGLDRDVVPQILHGGFRILLVGHASAEEEESAEARVLLGYRRAQALQAHFLAVGVPAWRLELASLGSKTFAATRPGAEAPEADAARVDVVVQ